MKQKVLLIGWDGADWEIARPLIAAGLLPHLGSLVREGCSGDLVSYAPFLSPILWTTIATGHDPDRHGVHGFAEVDSTGRARAVGSDSRKTKALWNIVSEQGGTADVVGWMGSFPAEALHGRYVADAFAQIPSAASGENIPSPLSPGCVYPPALADELAEFRMGPDDVDPRLLGLFVPDLLSKAHPRDPRPRRLLERLAQLYTLHNTSIALLEREQPDLFAVYFHFLDLICHEFVAFHPPRHPKVGLADFELYQHVVAGAYRVQDALLGDLLRHCSPDTAVILVSDHGFTTGASRPDSTPRSDAALAAWHRREGIFAARGSGVRKGASTGLVRPRDIAPTVLSWLGLPHARDLPGRVITELFETHPQTESIIESWETEPARVPPPALPAAPPAPDEARRLTQRFIELGYLDPAAQNDREGGAKVADENRFHLGSALRDLGRPADALPHLQAASFADPESTTRAVELAGCLLDLGLSNEAEEAARPFFDHEQDTPRAWLLRAEIALGRAQFSRLWPLLDRLASTPFAEKAGRLRRLALIRSKRWNDALAAFRAQLKLTPLRATAHLGLGEACLQSGQLAEAATAAKRALELDPALILATDLLARIDARRAGKPSGTASDWSDLAACVEERAELRRDYERRESALVAERAARHNTRSDELAEKRRPILVVSGAPRSGTSLMMRMLALAGMPILTDGVREPDTHNPLGYYEWEPAKHLASAPEAIAAGEGKAVKIVSPLLPLLPSGWRYDVIFMRRNTASILRSQDHMLAGQGAELSADELDRHIAETLAQAGNRPNVRLLEIDYDELLDSTEAVIPRLVDFLGTNRLKRPAMLLGAINPDLRHHRRGESSIRPPSAS